MTFDIQALRAQFPALNQQLNGETPIYLDNPAGTQVPQRVIDAVSHYFVTMNANQGGAFHTSQRTDEMIYQTRQKLALLLNAPNPDEIVLGPNMTTLNFALTRAIAKTLQAEDEIVLTRMDHDANVSPYLRIAEDYGLVVRFVEMKLSDCTLDMDSLEAALTDKTRLVAIVHASNAVGSINPVAQIAAMAHAAGALYIVDAVQSTPHLTIDVQAIGCDFLLCSSYKFFGPHMGVLWGRYDLLAQLPAYKVRPSKDTPPFRWETGTPAFELIAGVGACVDYLASLTGQKETTRAALIESYVAMNHYERELATHLIADLQAIPGVQIAGITQPQRMAERVPTVVFSLEGYSPTQVATHLAKHDIYVWDGNYYAVEVMQSLNKPDGMVRVGLAHYNTHEEIDRMIAVLKQLASK
jgi:cysteine desulfurase family protein (TIGR01976 family)